MIAWVLITLAGMTLAGVVGHGMGVRRERGKHARWSAIVEAHLEERKRIGGVTLRRIRVTR